MESDLPNYPPALYVEGWALTAHLPFPYGTVYHRSATGFSLSVFGIGKIVVYVKTAT